MCFDSKVLRWKLIDYRRRRTLLSEAFAFEERRRSGSTFRKMDQRSRLLHLRAISAIGGKKGKNEGKKEREEKKREIKEEFVRREKNSCSVGECNLFQIPEARLSDDWGMVKRKRVCNEGRIIEFALGGWMNIPK